jgi:glycosyltransferase involved in cell wall biosynthesis
LIPTHDRPELLREALRSALRQEYAGPLSVAVIFDRQDVDADLRSTGPVPVRVLANDRTPGLAGARNTGILTSEATLVAFLDDDDRWLPGKLARQVQRFGETADAEFATTGISVEFEDRSVPRLAGTSSVTHEQLLESRMAMLHSSTFLIRRDRLLDGIGLVDESAPASQNEDWDLLLRASARRDIVHLDEPLVAVRWGSTSLFAGAWESKIAAAEWIIRQHPELRETKRGHARLLGQIAFAHAALGHRRQALAYAHQSMRTRWREPRGYLAMAAACGVAPPAAILRTLHRRGHGV